jgi:guanylate kinase
MTVVGFVGCSGSGKSTLIKRLVRYFNFGYSISHTTRKIRKGEVDGKHYHFVSDAEFERMVTAGEFIEHATAHGSSYGTSKFALMTGKNVAMDIEVCGAKKFKETLPDFLCFLILPSSLEILEERLIRRGTETREQIAKRMEDSRKWLEEYKLVPELFDETIVNDNIRAAFDHVAEALRKRNVVKFDTPVSVAEDWYDRGISDGDGPDSARNCFINAATYDPKCILGLSEILSRMSETETVQIRGTELGAVDIRLRLAENRDPEALLWLAKHFQGAILGGHVYTRNQLIGLAIDQDPENPDYWAFAGRMIGDGVILTDKHAYTAIECKERSIALKN